LRANVEPVAQMERCGVGGINGMSAAAHWSSPDRAGTAAALLALRALTGVE